MRNQFPGVCFRCGKTVAAGAGHFEKVTKVQIEKYGDLARGYKWLVQHADCAIQHRGTVKTCMPDRAIEDGADDEFNWGDQ